MSLIDIQTIQSQVDFHNVERIIEDEVQEKEHKKMKNKCNFAKDIEKILQHRQFKYKVIFCISSEEKKIIY